ncbi:hypothetical protein ACKRZS_007967 [Fusarium odoratissimum]
MTSCPRLSRKVSECESVIAYEFNSKSLCAQALNTAADAMSVCVLDGSFKQMPKNDRLAVYGDVAAAAYLCSLWIKRELPKHCWTTLRRDLISNDNLARVGRGHGLHKCINMKGGTTRVSSGMVATAVEAILGAVENDGGRDALAWVMKHLGLTEHALLESVKFFFPLTVIEQVAQITHFICIGAFAATVEFPCDISLRSQGLSRLPSQEAPEADPLSTRLSLELAPSP